MEVHYTKHHQAYVDKLNAALQKYPGLLEMGIEDLLKKINTLKVDEKDRTAIKNNGGGHANHSFFWQIMGPEKEIDTALTDDIKKTFGSAEEFKKKFNEMAASHFGSGWCWLVRDPNGSLEICTTPNQDSPLSEGHMPIITLDLWEHAYYLKYQNRRAEYIDAWWNVLKLI
jgi:Fe-Mn family superoxide dismutase